MDASGALFIRNDDKNAELREVEEVLVIPHSLQRQAVSVIHDTVLGGHAATDRTLFAAKRRFYWRNMKRTIQKYVQNCKICQVQKGRAHPKQPLRQFPLPDKPFDVVSTDLIGPLKITVRGNRYILVVTDFLTRYVVIQPLPDKTASTVAEGLWRIMCEHGCPSVLYSDSGAEFRNKVLTEMTRKFKISHFRFAVYHPSSNGLTERKNASILEALRCFQDWEDWDMVLPTAQLAVNAAYSSSLGDSPFYVYRSKDPEIPQTRFAKPKFSYAEDLSFEKMRQRREYLVMETVKQKLLEASEASGRRRLKRSKERQLSIGDRVFIRRIQKKGESKLVPRWKGPYRIISQKSPNVYKLKDLTTSKSFEQHIENIKNSVCMARESEIPLEQCPNARLPFQEEETTEPRRSARVRAREGTDKDDFVDDSFLLQQREEMTQNV